MSNGFETFDAIIIGSGQGGNPLAISLAKAGWQVALVESKHVGGSCVNTACTPTKAMIASAKIAHIIRKAADYGINSTLDSVDMLKIIKRKTQIVEDFRQGSLDSIVSTKGITLIKGEAHFVGKKKVEVKFHDNEKRLITADTIIINTGASSSTPPIPGLDTSDYLDSTSLMEINQLPEHLLVLGGGYVGLEFGQMFRHFGSKVTIIQIDKQLLPNEDEDIAKEVTTILQKEGIEIFLNTKTIKINSPAKNKVNLVIQKDNSEKTLEGSHLLVATGHRPNTPALNLQSTGIKVNKKGYIPVNDYLETEVPGIFAIGDVKGGPAFTHIAYDDYRILSKNILQKEQNSISGRQLPYVVYIDPQLGRIGMNEKEAKKRGYDYLIARMPMSWVARAIETGETEGMIKVIVEAKTDKILGAVILGAEGGEVMAILQVAMLGNLPYTVIRDAIFSHPSIAESLNTLFETMDS